MNEKNTNKRLPYIDCIRVMACFLVVAVHCNYTATNPANTIYTQILGVIGSPSSELFLAISGSLLIPVHTSQKAFFKRRLTKLIPPFVVWSLFGIWYMHFTGRSAGNIMIQLISIPIINATIPIYWFMYTIMGMYLLAPIISPYLLQKGREGGVFLLTLWIVTLLLPLTNIIYPGFYKNNVSGIFYTFSGYAGYMVLGWYLRSYPFWFVGKRGGWCYPACALVGMATIIALVGLFAPSYRDYVMDNLSFGNMLYVVAIFTLIQSLFQQGNVITGMAQRITKYTFGIYLIHIFVVHSVYAVFEEESYPAVLQLPITALLSFVLSLLIVWMLSQIKLIKWIVQGLQVK